MAAPTYDILIESLPTDVAVGEMQRWMLTWCGALALPSLEVSVTVGNDDLLYQLNKAYREKAAPTDVLSFPMYMGGPKDVLQEIAEEIERFADREDGFVPTLGDIVISWQQVQQQSESYEETTEEVLQRLMCHGLLHLLGYDHETGEEDAALMRAKEDSLLELLATGKEN